MKPLRGYEDKYLVSEDGRIWSNEKNDFMKSHINNRGYVTIGFRKNKKSTSVSVHRLVALTYCGSPKDGQVVHFKDGNRQNIHKDNLMWAFPKRKKKIEKATEQRSRIKQKAELSEMDIQDIVKLSEKFTISQIASAFSAPYKQIDHIVSEYRLNRIHEKINQRMYA